MVNGFKMALDEANNRVGGATIVYEDLDDATPAKGAWDAAKEAENANRAVNDPDVMVYSGTFNSGAAKVSIPILNRANLVMIRPANTYPGLTKPGTGEANEPGTYQPGWEAELRPRRACRRPPGRRGRRLGQANWCSKVYMLDDTELYGHGIAVVFADTAKKIGLNVVGGPEGIDTRASDYRALAQKIRGTSPDLVYFGGITQSNAGKLSRTSAR